MVSAGSYILSAAALAALALSLGFSAVRLRRRLLPEWQGAPAHLVEAIAAVALLIWLSELLGILNLLYAWTLLPASLLLAAAIAIWSRSAPAAVSSSTTSAAAGGGRDRAESSPLPGGGTDLGDHPEEQPHRRGGGAKSVTGPAGPNALSLVAIAAVAVVFAHWGLTAKDALGRGIFNFDSLWYHMPFAVEMAQSHSVTGLHYTETVFTNWFYPQNSELLHAVAVLFSGRDTLSLFLNFGWLAIAFLAAWCIGRPYGKGPLSVVAAAVILECHTLVVREPGAAKNDLMAAALLLAAIAILINAWAAQRASGARRTARAAAQPAGGAAAAEATPAGPPDRGHDAGRLQPGWPLAAAGLATGLAVGTKSTTLAMAAALTVAVLVLAPLGRRWAAAGWWFLPAFAGGGFWYLRNLIAAGNPLPQLEGIGPLALPHPERLQTGRPDFSIAHYATDTAVWREYFAPGLEQAFGVLWPLVVGGAIAGALLALLRGGERIVRWGGGVALFGVLAYLVTPLSAAGAEGAPVGFAINIRYAIPALLAGAALLPLVLAARRPGGRDRPGPGPVDGPETDAYRRESAHRLDWLLLAALLAVMVVTNRADAVLRDPDRLFGLLVASLAVLIPAALLLLAAACGRWGTRSVVAGFAILALAVVAIGYPLQRDYLRDRFGPGSGIPDMHLDSAYQWAGAVGDSRIGLAGTTAGFLQYGFYGNDLSNQVQYLGEKGPHGSFNAIPSCGAFRDAVNRAGLDYLITSPFLNFVHPDEPVPSPEARWLRGEDAVAALDHSGPVTVWRLRAPLDPAACGPANAPLRQLPQTPGT